MALMVPGCIELWCSSWVLRIFHEFQLTMRPVFVLMSCEKIVHSQSLRGPIHMWKHIQPEVGGVDHFEGWHHLNDKML